MLQFMAYTVHVYVLHFLPKKLKAGVGSGVGGKPRVGHLLGSCLFQ